MTAQAAPREAIAMVLHVVPPYAAVLALVCVVLAVRVAALRRSLNVAIGTGGNPALERRVRVHANFAEYVPITLILLVLMEIRGQPGWYLNVLCLALLAGRLTHAYSLSLTPDILSTRHALRAVGAMLTLETLVFASVTLLVDAL
jgi:uncharacterized protein